mmetsp:Transcript_27629/g.49841  ORF Transcript_27629/g.49841 Transcript_27629/m.49841 type:complete len:415 (-) Transcript_27629:17-1261(-)
MMLRCCCRRSCFSTSRRRLSSCSRSAFSLMSFGDQAWLSSSSPFSRVDSIRVCILLRYRVRASMRWLLEFGAGSSDEGLPLDLGVCIGRSCTSAAVLVPQSPPGAAPSGEATDLSVPPKFTEGGGLALPRMKDGLPYPQVPWPQTGLPGTEVRCDCADARVRDCEEFRFSRACANFTEPGFRSRFRSARAAKMRRRSPQQEMCSDSRRTSSVSSSSTSPATLWDRNCFSYLPRPWPISHPATRSTDHSLYSGSGWGAGGTGSTSLKWTPHSPRPSSGPGSPGSSPSSCCSLRRCSIRRWSSSCSASRSAFDFLPFFFRTDFGGGLCEERHVPLRSLKSSSVACIGVPKVVPSSGECCGDEGSGDCCGERVRMLTERLGSTSSSPTGSWTSSGSSTVGADRGGTHGLGGLPPPPP